MDLSAICCLDDGEDLKIKTPTAVDIFFARLLPPIAQALAVLAQERTSLRQETLSFLRLKAIKAR